MLIITNIQASQKLPKDKARVRQVVRKFNEKSGSSEDISAEKLNPNDEAAQSECLLRTVMDPSDSKRISYHEIDLGPGALLDLLKDIMREEDVNEFWASQHVALSTPFRPLVHKWDKLKDEADTEKTDDTPQRKEAREDLGRVLDFVKRSKDLESYFKTRESYRSAGVVDYKNLWTIFAVGTEVIASTFLEEKQIMIVGYEPFEYSGEKSQSVWCWYYDHDGTNWVVAEKEFEIDRYTSTRPINTFSCYPLENYKPNGESTDISKLKDEFIKRGQNFKALCTTTPGVQQMFNYKDQLLSVENHFRSQYSNDGKVENYS